MNMVYCHCNALVIFGIKCSDDDVAMPKDDAVVVFLMLDVQYHKIFVMWVQRGINPKTLSRWKQSLAWLA